MLTNNFLTHQYRPSSSTAQLRSTDQSVIVTQPVGKPEARVVFSPYYERKNITFWLVAELSLLLPPNAHQFKKNDQKVLIKTVLYFQLIQLIQLTKKLNKTKMNPATAKQCIVLPS